MRPSLLNKANVWLTRIVSYPGDDEETLIIKKIWFVTVVAFTFISSVFSFQWLFDLGMNTLFIFQLVYFTFFTVLLLLFLWIRRGIEWFVIATAVYHVLVTFVSVCIMGGIAANPGIVVAGWGGGPVYFLLIRKYRKWAIHFQIFFMLTVVVEGLLQPYLTPGPEYSPGVEAYMFSGFFLSVTLGVFLMLRYSMDQNAKIKEAEKERIRELATMKARFYTNITHEFRTPLTVILGMADQIQAKPGDHFRSGLSQIRQNGNRLLQLVNQMLNLSKLEAGVMPVRFIQGDVIPYIQYVVEPFQRLAEEKNSRVRLTDCPDRLELDFDPEKLESLLGNLLSNAVKYSPQGSDIRVSVSAAENNGLEDTSWFSLFGRKMDGKNWRLVVKDNGKGISAGELNRIFDRFYQAGQNENSGPNYNTEGTGIGLSVVKELVRLLEGELYVKSALGEGTEFRVYLPFRNEAPPAPAAAAVPLGTHDEELLSEGDDGAPAYSGLFKNSHPQILVVEDNSGVVQYLRAILEEDYQIGVAADGQEGIEMALESVPDLIITDVMMPRKDGFELCRTLKNDFRTSHIPIIMLTAKADMESTIAGLEQGADAYITKPFNSRELSTRIRKLIELRDHLREKYRAMTLPSSPVAAAPSSPDEEFFGKLKNAMEAHSGDEEFHSGQLCQMLGLSRVQLFRKLKALTGVSASQFVRTFRLNKAKEMLTTTDLNISEIAFEVGFRDPAYFTRAFIKEFGVAPSSFRK